MHLVEFKAVRRQFGEVVALTGLDLTVETGEVFGLLGPNGAGKTTALRILCGLLSPNAGQVTIGGHDVQTDPLAARSQYAYVPDGAPLYANLTPLQHLHLVGRLHGMQESDFGPESERLLERLDLGDRATSPVGTLSRGMRQKAALACAILPRPPLLILDEPLSGLDAPTAAVFKEVLKTWAADGGAVLYTSHLLDVAERVCTRIAILAHGELVGLGTLDELRERAGRDGTLEQVFGTLAQTDDPAERARALLDRTRP